MNFWKIADLFHKLMTDVLGQEKYAAAGSDMGSLVTAQLGHKYQDSLYAIHLGSPIPLAMFSGDRAWDLTGGAQIPEASRTRSASRSSPFTSASRRTSPCTSWTPARWPTASPTPPVGMLAWILERWTNWSDNDGDVENVWTKDELLTNATIYWVTNSIGTSMRAYANAHRYPWTPSHDLRPAVQTPTGITLVGYENPPGVTTENRVADFLKSPREPWFNHVNVTAHPRGGHFIRGSCRTSGSTTSGAPSAAASPESARRVLIGLPCGVVLSTSTDGGARPSRGDTCRSVYVCHYCCANRLHGRSCPPELSALITCSHSCG